MVQKLGEELWATAAEGVLCCGVVLTCCPPLGIVVVGVFREGWEEEEVEGGTIWTDWLDLL